MARLGLIARADNSGLGTLSLEFYKHLIPTKTLVITNQVYKSFPERFNENKAYKTDELSTEQINDFLDGLDVVLALETPYNWQIFVLARARKIKTVLVSMYECNAKPLLCYPDLIICPSKIDYNSFAYENVDKILLPLPVNRKTLSFKQKHRARIFLHNVGHGGLLGRNGTSELIRAISLVKNKDVKFIIHSQIPLIQIDDARITVIVGNVDNYADLYSEGDVYIMPQRLQQISLPVNEAMSCGLPVITTNWEPFKNCLPSTWLIETCNVRVVKLYDRDINYCEIDLLELANKIDWFADRDINKDSLIADSIADEISWDKLLTRWQNVLYN